LYKKFAFVVAEADKVLIVTALISFASRTLTSSSLARYLSLASNFD
jgi:hypothetical protein